MAFDFPTYKEFAKNPLVALFFICVIALGYLYLDGRKAHEDSKKYFLNEINSLKEELKEVREDYDTLKDKLIETTLLIEQ